MASVVIKRQYNMTHPVWAKDYLDREHVLPGGVRVDASLFPRDNSVNVATSGAAGVDEKQTLTITGTPTGGTWTATLSGQTTAPIAYNATAAQVEAALELLSTVGVGNVAVTGGPGPGTAFVVEFIGDLAETNVAAMTASGASLTGGTSPAVGVSQTLGGVQGHTLIGSTALPVTAISGAIPANTVLVFNTGQIAYVSAPAVSGATTLIVDALVWPIPHGAQAAYMGSGQVRILAGTPIGRTTAEQDVGALFGPAATDGSDDEVYLLVHDIDDALLDADADCYRPGGLVDIAHLPNWSTLAAGLKAQIRTLYHCMRGAS